MRNLVTSVAALALLLATSGMATAKRYHPGKNLLQSTLQSKTEDPKTRHLTFVFADKKGPYRDTKLAPMPSKDGVPTYDTADGYFPLVAKSLIILAAQGKVRGTFNTLHFLVHPGDTYGKVNGRYTAAVRRHNAARSKK